jgi:exonuclease SbcC
VRAIQLHNEYAIDLTRRTPMDVTHGRGPRLFQVRVIHEDVCRTDEMQLHTSSPAFDTAWPEFFSFETEASATLETARTAHAAATAQNAAIQQQTEAAAKEEAKATNDQLLLRTRLTALQQNIAAITGRLKDAGLPEDAMDAEFNDTLAKAAADQAHLQTLHTRLSSMEIGLDAVTTAAALSRLRDNVNKLEKSLAPLKKRRSELKPWQTYFLEIGKLVSSEQQGAIDNFAQQYGPRTSIIQRRLRSVYGFDDIKISSSKSEIRVSVGRNGEDFRPIDYFSQSQQQTLLLGLFLTACSSQNWSSFSPVLLDDPVTHFDDLNTYALLDLILGLLRSDMGHRQFIISTCDEKLLQLAQQKFAHLGDGAVFYRFTSISEDGPEVERLH